MNIDLEAVVEVFVFEDRIRVDSSLVKRVDIRVLKHEACIDGESAD